MATQQALSVNMQSQPDDETCGPTSLHAVYNFYGLPNTLDEVIGNVTFLKRGGTLGVYLATHALQQGLEATIYTYNLKMFDPTWMETTPKEMIKKLKQQMEVKRSRHFREVTLAYLRFLKMGGQLKLENLNSDFIKKFLHAQIPILTGLSATFLYQSKREHSPDKISIYDDIKGKPMGHFVVIMGQSATGKFLIADPYKGNPISRDNYYEVESSRLINAILLGVMTYDANIIIIESKK
jgi:hypothetical protein